MGRREEGVVAGTAAQNPVELPDANANPVEFRCCKTHGCHPSHRCRTAWDLPYACCPSPSIPLDPESAVEVCSG